MDHDSVVKVKTVNNMFFLIDKADLAMVSKHKWYGRKRDRRTYVYTSISGRQYALSRFLLGIKHGDRRQVDHKDHNGLNNCRKNLRICTNKQNSYNRRKPNYASTSKYKGVSKRDGGYVVQIELDNRNHYVVTCSNEEQAAIIYDQCAMLAFGEFACTNFDRSNYSDFIKKFNSLDEFRVDCKYTKEKIFTSKFHGVSKVNNKWSASSNRYIGLFASEHEAAIAYNEDVLKNNLNKPINIFAKDRVQIINMGSTEDDRGKIKFINEFPSDVKRIYFVENHEPKWLRAFHGHIREAKYVVVMSGSAIIAAVPMECFDPEKNNNFDYFKIYLSENSNKIVRIDKNMANGALTLSPGTKLMYMSTSSLEESRNDDFRFSPELFKDIWEVKER